MTGFRLTHEQAAACDGFMRDGHMRLVAYAGTGKTSTLIAMASTARHKSCTYIAFNRAIAADAQTKFPGNVTARTAHSLAYRAAAAMGYPQEKMRAPVNTRSLGIRRGEHGQMIVETLRRFCQSADLEVGYWHCPRPRRSPVAPPPAFPGLAQADARDEEAEIRELRQEIAGEAARIWQRMSRAGDPTPLGHDGYVKVWQLTRPRLMSPVLLVDEAQDLNPVLIDVILTNLENTQVVAVGDAHQQIYGWRGAVDALQRIPGDEYRLTQSFRFGERIAAYANELLVAMGETVPLRGNGRTDDRVLLSSSGVSTATLCRSNAAAVGECASLLAEGCGVYVPGGVAEMRALIEDAERLIGGEPAQTMELIGFVNWREVQEAAEDGGAGDLRKLVSLVDRFGCSKLRGVFDRVLPAPAMGAVTVSTAHKAKGLEWHSVAVCDDFQIEDPSVEERRLFYVACTRARQLLTVSPELSTEFKSSMTGGAGA